MTPPVLGCLRAVKPVRFAKHCTYSCVRRQQPSWARYSSNNFGASSDGHRLAAILHWKCRDMSQIQMVSTRRLQSKVSEVSKNKNFDPRHSASVFLSKVKTGSIPKELACQRTEELMLQLVKSPGIPSDGPLALDLLNCSLESATLPGERLIPRLFSLACQIMIGSGHPLASKEVNRQLWRLLSNHKKFFSEEIVYNSQHVNDAFAHFTSHLVIESNRNRRRLPTKSRKEIQKLKANLEDLYNKDDVPLVADAQSINAFVLFYCNQGEPEQALELLKWMVHETAGHAVDIIPRIMSFTATISAFAKVNPIRAGEIIDWMLTEHKSGSSKMPAPNVSCFNALLDAWTKSRKKDAGEKAESILEWMYNLHDMDGFDCVPDEISYNSCINAWAHSPNPQSPIRAEMVLRDLMERNKYGTSVTPSNVTFISVMNAWANSGRADAPGRVQGLLHLMESLPDQASNTDHISYCYAVLVKAWEKQIQKRTDMHRRVMCADEILNVSRQMQLEQIQKSPVIHNAIIMALRQCSPVFAVLYFLELEEKFCLGSASAMIDVRTFNSGLSALAALNKPDAADRSIQILNRMLRYSKNHPEMKPNSTTFNVVLKALSRSQEEDAALQADELLKEMEVMGSLVSATSYVTVIIAWGRSQRIDKLSRVKEILQRYHLEAKNNKHLTSTPHVHNAVLSVCQHNSTGTQEEREFILEVAVFCMQDLKSLRIVRPDQTTYSTLFKVLENLSLHADLELEKLFELHFEDCIKAGLVTQDAVSSIFKSSKDTFFRVFGDNQTPASARIPKDWSRHTLTTSK